MKPFILTSIALGMVAVYSASADDNRTPQPARESLDRALKFLSREVPQWSTKNKCYSCHNNGDAARALFVAARFGRRVEPKALADTLQWLQKPQDWKHNGGEGVYSDKKLATLQFAASLAEAVESGLVKDRAPLLNAAGLLAGYQESDGSWIIDAEGTVGSPVTYGSFLATAMGRRVLNAADDERFRERIIKADHWLRAAKPKTVLDAAATIIGLGSSSDEAALAQRAQSLKLIVEGQNTSGGWGPFVSSRAEAFDTAVVLLALSSTPLDNRHREMISRGRQYLIEKQFDDGSWPETTRPAGADSYAQRISTTGWATLALLATQPAAAPKTK